MIRAIIVFYVVMATPVLADTWKSGWGQGVAEAFVEKGPGNRIRVACEDGWGRPISNISITLGREEPRPGSAVTFIFDNTDPIDINVGQNGDFESNSRAEAGAFDLLISKLKAHNSVYVRFANGLGTRFSLKGSADAIGDCPSDFSKTFN